MYDGKNRKQWRLNHRYLLNSKPVETIIIQIYMPTSDCEDQTSLAFYEEIEKVTMKLGGRKDRVTIVMGDLTQWLEKLRLMEL